MQVEHTNSLTVGRARRTPIGVEILAALMTLAGILFVIVGLAFFISGPSEVGNSVQPGGIATAWVGVGAAAGVIFLIFGVLHEVLAFGLIRLRDTARILSVLLFGLSAIGASLGLMATLVRFRPTAVAWNAAVVAADAAALWYLRRPQVKEVFRGSVATRWQRSPRLAAERRNDHV